MKVQLIIVLLLVGIINTQGQSPPLRLTSADENLNILALPVGQGDATIIQCPTQYGGKLTVVDMGSSKYKGFMGKEDITNYLDEHIIEKVFLSHPDKDHNNFLDAALSILHPQYYPIVYHSCNWTKYQNYVKTTGIKTERILFCCGGDCPSYRICDGNVTVAVLASEHNKCSRGGTNGDSLVLQVQFADVKVLLPGDFEGSKTLIDNFLQCAGQHVQSHIFRLAHHGAFNIQPKGNRYVNTYEFLEAVRPYYAFSSAGLHERYHHPRCEVYEGLEHYLSTVSGHYYTCYTKRSSNDQWMYHTGITKAIFVTTVVKPNTKTVINYIIKFRINITGEVKHHLQEFNKIRDRDEL